MQRCKLRSKISVLPSSVAAVCVSCVRSYKLHGSEIQQKRESASCVNCTQRRRQTSVDQQLYVVDTMSTAAAAAAATTVNLFCRLFAVSASIGPASAAKVAAAGGGGGDDVKT